MEKEGRGAESYTQYIDEPDHQFLKRERSDKTERSRFK
jgi:hypothetical protein